MSTSTTIAVTGTNPYDVVIGRDILGTVADQLGPDVNKILIVHPATLTARATALRESLLGQYEVLLAEIPDAETGKRVEVAAFCWGVLGKADFTRTDAVIGFGGGAVTDLAGFVAATWLRGVKLVQVPTTLLGMVDAAIGGKTGINTAEGKNLVGAFYAPAAVVIDLDVLHGLNQMEILAGFGEVVKCGFIAEAEILDIIEADVDTARSLLKRSSKSPSKQRRRRPEMLRPHSFDVRVAQPPPIVSLRRERNHMQGWVFRVVVHTP